MKYYSTIDDMKKTASEILGYVWANYDILFLISILEDKNKKIDELEERIKQFAVKYCFECGEEAMSEEHHIIPKSRGGKRTIPICSSCHAKVHNNKKLRTDCHKTLVLDGLAKARARGIKGGRPKKITSPEEIEEMKMMYKNGDNVSNIYKKFKISKATFYRLIQN